jgi:hypothetical protein
VEKIRVGGSGNIAPLVSLVSTNDDSQIIFQTYGSTFNALAAQADNGIVVAIDILTSGGAMYLDGDLENSSTQDGLNSVGFTDGLVLTAHSVLTLESSTGDIAPVGTVTLQAGAGIVILDDMTSVTTGKAVVIKPDFESAGDGVLTVVATKTVTTVDAPMVITAWDIDVSGALATGTGTLSIHGSKSNQTIGLGATAGDMNVEDTELQRITSAGGLRVGASSGGHILIDGISATGSSHLDGTVSLIVLQDNSQVTFNTTASTFRTLVTQADNGVLVQADITTTVGQLTIDGDLDNDGAQDGHDQIAISGARTISSTGQMTLDSTSGGIWRYGAST